MAGTRPDRPREIARIALTGGIASGKSTVAKLFTALGAKLIDTDQIARDIVVPPSPVLEQIAVRFGPHAPSGLDRRFHRRYDIAQPLLEADLAEEHPGPLLLDDKEAEPEHLPHADIAQEPRPAVLA